MTALSKVLLTVAVTGLTGGTVIDCYSANANPGLTAVLPLGAIAFGMFLIVFMLEKEMAKYDEEQMEKMQRLQCSTIPPFRQQEPSPHAVVTQLKEKTL